MLGYLMRTVLPFRNRHSVLGAIPSSFANSDPVTRQRIIQSWIHFWDARLFMIRL